MTTRRRIVFALGVFLAVLGFGATRWAHEGRLVTYNSGDMPAQDLTLWWGEELPADLLHSGFIWKLSVVGWIVCATGLGLAASSLPQPRRLSACGPTVE